MSETAHDPAPTGRAVAAPQARPAPRSGLNPRTGEPRRPWFVWATGALFVAGAGLAIAGLLQMMWVSVDRFPEASWLNGIVASEPGDGIRVTLVLAQFAIALTIAGLATIAAHYAWRGYAWPRWWGLATALAAAMALMINPLASWAIAPIGVAAALLWTPPLRRFAARWWEHRHPVVPVPEREGAVVYGPLPRFR